VGVINHDPEGLPGIDAFHAAGDASHRADRRGGGGQIHPFDLGQGQRGQGVLDVE